MKTCTGCKIEKPLDQYNKQKDGAMGLTAWCKHCLAAKKKEWYDNGGAENSKKRARINNLRNIYNITEEEYVRCMATSDHCEICKSLNDLCYDHDHSTMKFRGVLCRTCNRHLGGLGDDLKGLLRAVHYLI